MAIDSFEKDKDLIVSELQQQIHQRVREHLYMKERKDSDFVKPRRSEQSLFDSQLDHLEWAADEKRMEEPETKDFSKEQYLELKKEISLRREAKERLLEQGYPEFKSYLRI